MKNYLIEHTRGYDFITSLEHAFTLKVIPPERREADPEYTPYQVVSAVFDGDKELPVWMVDPGAEVPDDWHWDESINYDFEGVTSLLLTTVSSGVTGKYG